MTGVMPLGASDAPSARLVFPASTETAMSATAAEAKDDETTDDGWEVFTPPSVPTTKGPSVSNRG